MQAFDITINENDTQALFTIILEKEDEDQHFHILQGILKFGRS